MRQNIVAESLEALLYNLYTLSLADRPVLVELDLVVEKPSTASNVSSASRAVVVDSVTDIATLVKIVAVQLHRMLKGFPPAYCHLAELYARLDPNPAGKLVVATSDDFETMYSVGKNFVEEPRNYIMSLFEALPLSQLGYMIVYPDAIDLLEKELGTLYHKMLKNATAVRLHARYDQLYRELTDVLDFAGLNVANNTPYRVAEAIRTLKEEQRKAIEDELVHSLLRLNVDRDTGEVRETPEHFLTKALVVKTLVEKLRNSGVKEDEIAERIRVEDEETLQPATPDIVYEDEQENLTVYEIETLLMPSADPLLYLYEKYTRTKRLKEAPNRYKIKELYIVLPNITALIAYPKQHRKQLREIATKLSKQLLERQEAVKIATIDLKTKTLKTITN